MARAIRGRFNSSGDRHHQRGGPLDRCLPRCWHRSAGHRPQTVSPAHPDGRGSQRAQPAIDPHKAAVHDRRCFATKYDAAPNDIVHPAGGDAGWWETTIIEARAARTGAPPTGTVPKCRPGTGTTLSTMRRNCAQPMAGCQMAGCQVPVPVLRSGSGTCFTPGEGIVRRR